MNKIFEYIEENKNTKDEYIYIQTTVSDYKYGDTDVSVYTSYFKKLKEVNT